MPWLARTKLILVFLSFAVAQPAFPKELTVAIPNRIETMDPLLSEVIQERFLMPLVYETLFQVRNDGDFFPGIVRTWKFDSKNQRLILDIQQDRKFEDGSPITTLDVVKSLNELCSHGSKAASAFFTLPECGAKPNTFKKETATTISVRISSSPNFALGNLAYGRALIYKRDGNKIFSSGRYRYELNKSGGIDLIPNPHALPTKIPAPSKIIFSFLPESDIQEAITKKRFDVFAMYLSSHLTDGANSDFKVIVHSPFITQALVLNPNSVPADRVAGLREISSLVRNSNFVACTSKAYPANGIIPMGILGSRTVPNTIKLAISAPSKNKALYPLTLHRHVEKRSVCEEDLIRDIGKRNGFDIKFSYSEGYQDLFKIFRDTSTNGFIELFSFSSRDPSNILRRFSSFDSDNIFHFKSPVIGNLLKEAWHKDSSAARKPIYTKIQNLIETQSLVSPLYYVGHTIMIRNCIDLRGDGKWRHHPNPFYLFLEQEIGAGQCD